MAILGKKTGFKKKTLGGQAKGGTEIPPKVIHFSRNTLSSGF
jgi:hypothetical protein